jgi:hypothetical protein
MDLVYQGLAFIKACFCAIPGSKLYHDQFRTLLLLVGSFTNETFTRAEWNGI